MADAGTKRTRPAGVREVAAAANVSRQTVSRVINDNPDVAPATRERVLAAMARLDYRVNNAARVLGTSRSRTIGVLASDVLQYGPMRSLVAVEESARAAGYWVSTAFVDPDDEESVLGGIEHLRAQGVEGLVLFAPHAHLAERLGSMAFGIPTAMLLSAPDGVGAPGTSGPRAGGDPGASSGDAPVRGASGADGAGEAAAPDARERRGGHPSAAGIAESGASGGGSAPTSGAERPAASAVDQVAGARMAVAELADAGHTAIAHVAGPDEWLESRARRAGAEAELKARGLEPAVVIAGDWTPRAGYEAADGVLASGATAVFAANDQMALGLIGRLRALGVAVPEDVSVVGFDDTPEGEYGWPPLTTVRQDFAELARRAVAMVTGSEPSAEPLAPQLIRRGSVAPPRAIEEIQQDRGRIDEKAPR
ncbi:LacI family DNA-binding transcriptional regulator [Microbacterium halophytorum]|uniref:LacI family DNA-binding transcriptional regulator n=1 Tax=Microbacterium halophytorum TaxID=2067568 RepID=UPI000CFCB04B|nr:LacI family DNA-binding transcriptional regulator [Microbacterium halophytorum]